MHPRPARQPRSLDSRVRRAGRCAWHRAPRAGGVRALLRRRRSPAQAPHVALGVIGASPLPIAVGQRFSLKVTHFPSESAARAAIDQRKIEGAFVASPVERSGSSLPGRARPAPRRSAARSPPRRPRCARRSSSFRFTHCRVDDAGGCVSFLVVMALVVGGYLRRHRDGVRRIGDPGSAPRGAGQRAVCGALLTDTFAGPLIGAIPTSKFLVPRGPPHPCDARRRIRGAEVLRHHQRLINPTDRPWFVQHPWKRP